MTGIISMHGKTKYAFQSVIKEPHVKVTLTNCWPVVEKLITKALKMPNALD
jgi:hypothetical protein